MTYKKMKQMQQELDYYNSLLSLEDLFDKNSPLTKDNDMFLAIRDRYAYLFIKNEENNDYKLFSSMHINEFWEGRFTITMPNDNIDKAFWTYVNENCDLDVNTKLQERLKQSDRDEWEELLRDYGYNVTADYIRVLNKALWEGEIKPMSDDERDKFDIDNPNYNNLYFSKLMKKDDILADMDREDEEQCRD